ncbi:MAG: cytochrome c, partial [Proteobacteria bacterium]|nr:cytochrome c [Pseudomonadota bacterium]
TEEGKQAISMAGGRALETPFGTFYSPNITPDPATGIGAWTDEEFLSAFWDGVNPDGEHYYPAFPFTSYTGISRADLLAIKAYLFSLEPVAKPTPEHDLALYISTRLVAGAWKLRNFKSGRFTPSDDRSAAWNRGAYLVRHLGHCGECHTPRDSLGAIQDDRELAGNRDAPDGESIPNISPHRVDGIGKWSVDDIEYFLDIGILPDGDSTGGVMSAVVDNNTSKLTRGDRLAIATYLKTVPAQRGD